MTKKELEARLITYTVLIVEMVEGMPGSKSANHLSGQLLRSGTSPALNYGEVQSGESRKDFIHKIKIVLKELRETHICLQIIDRTKLHSSEEKMQQLLKESNELISIFVKSADTADRNVKAQLSKAEM
jgi:four helix bundle protein